MAVRLRKILYLGLRSVPAFLRRMHPLFVTDWSQTYLTLRLFCFKILPGYWDLILLNR